MHITVEDQTNGSKLTLCYDRNNRVCRCIEPLEKANQEFLTALEVMAKALHAETIEVVSKGTPDGIGWKPDDTIVWRKKI